MSQKVQAVANRLLSLDVFRGITIATMILVNNMGSHDHVYRQLGHSAWDGCTVADLVFPFFLFIIGVSIYYAVDAKKGTVAHSVLLKSAARRSAILMGLTFILFLIPKIFDDPLNAFKTLRIQGVLFRIALVYFICTFLFLKTTLRTQVIIGVLFLLVYWALLTFVPVPDVGYPNLNAETNLSAWLDRLIFTQQHLMNKTWDPQGLLGTIPACSTTILGIVAGSLLKSTRKTPAEKTTWILVLGIGCTLAGMLWDQQFPINKALWSSSYVLYTGGLGCIGLALCYWLIDVQGYKTGTAPFVAFGRNAIGIYFLSELLPRVMNMIKLPTADSGVITLRAAVNSWFIKPLLSSPYPASLASGVFYVLVFLALAWWMYKRNIIVKI